MSALPNNYIRFVCAIVSILAVTVTSAAVSGCGSVRPEKVQRKVAIPDDSKNPKRGSAHTEDLAEPVLPFPRPKIDTRQWQWSMQTLEDIAAVEFNAPRSWDILRNKAESGDGYVTAKSSISTADKKKIGMAAYVAQLAGNSPIYVLQLPSGKSAFVTVREVSIAPDNSSAAVSVLHTAVFDLGDRYGKFEIRYDRSLKWRFETLANAMIGTMDVTDG